MASRTSYFNGPLYRKTVLRFWPLWGLASFFALLVPLSLFLGNVFASDLSVRDLRSLYSSALSMLPTLLLPWAVICAVMVWNYLDTPRTVNAMHALPLRREALFLTHFLAGLTMLLLPFAVSGAGLVLGSLFNRCLDLNDVAVTVVIVLLQGFFYFSSATLVAHITGLMAAIPILYFILHFLEAVLEFVLQNLLALLLPGLTNSFYRDTGLLRALSPTVYFLSNSDYSSAEGGLGGVNVTINALYALLGLALLIAALLLYRRRKSESAGDVVAFSWMRPVFLVGVTACAALCGGLLLYSLLFQNLPLKPIAVGVAMTIAGLIGYYIARMLLTKSVRVFRTGWPGALVTAALCFVFAFTFALDLPGFSRYVPRVDQIEFLTLDTWNGSYDMKAGSDDAAIAEVLALHEALAAGRYIDGSGMDLTGIDETGQSVYVGLNYSLSSGREVVRRYHVFVSPEQIAVDGSAAQLLDQLIRSREMEAVRMKLNDPDFRLEWGDIQSPDYNYSVDLSTRERSALYAALREDVSAGRCGNPTWYLWDEGVYNREIVACLSFSGSDGENSYAGFDVNVTERMTATVACLKTLGYYEKVLP